MTHDDPAKADDGKTAMQRYAAWHTRNCNCIPADTAHQDDAHIDTDAAETRATIRRRHSMRSRKQSRRTNGDGVSVYWSMNRYVAQVTLGTSTDGKPKRKKLYGPRGDKSRAAKIGVEERATIYATRRGKGDGSAQLKTVIDQWIESAAESRDIRAKTKGFYEWISRMHLGKIGSIRLIDLEAADIKAHLKGLDAMPRTRRAVYGLIITYSNTPSRRR